MSSKVDRLVQRDNKRFNSASSIVMEAKTATGNRCECARNHCGNEVSKEVIDSPVM